MNSISWTGIPISSFDTNGKALNVYGSLQAHTNLAFIGSNGFYINFRASSNDNLINTAGKLLPPKAVIVFEGTGSWTLQSYLNAGQGGTINLNEGTLNTNGQPVAVTTFNSAGEKTRALILGTSSVTKLTHWNISPSLQLNAEASRITMNGPEKHLFNGGGKAYKTVIFHGPESIIYQSNSFKELSIPMLSATSGNTLTLESGQTQTIESLFTPGSAPYTTIKSSVAGRVADINFTSFRFCTDFLTISDVTAKGTGTYYAGLSSQSSGITTGWNFFSCGSTVYAPKTAADYDTTFSTVVISSTGTNKWQEVRFNNQLVGAIKDGGNALGEVSMDFTVSSNASRAAKNGTNTNIHLLPRNWRVKAANQPSTDKPISIRLYTVQTEFDNYKAKNTSVTGLNDLFVTSYSSADSTENCNYLDNVAEGSVTSLISNPTQTSAGSYFTTELTGITDFTELYLHNGGTAIDFVASQPKPVIIEEIDFTGHRNAKTVKLKWKTPADSNVAYYEVQTATSAESNDFKAIQQVERKNSGKAAVYVYDAEDFNPTQGPANYYRLKKVKTDGTFTYSQTIMVENKSYAPVVQASPNPFSDKIKLAVNAEKAGEMQVKLLTENGEVVLEKKIKVSKGASETELVISSKVKSGIYLLVTELNGERLSQRMIKQ